MKRYFAFLAVVLLTLIAVAGLAQAEEVEGDFPLLNEEGFLSEGEFSYKNATEGVWRYASQTLKVEVIRYYENKQTWYEAEVWAKEGERFQCIPCTNGDLDWPYKIAQSYGTVLAINGDFYHSRVDNKTRNGVLVRGGVAVGDQRTYAHNKGNFPNLDTMAIFADGSMEVFPSDAHTAEEYIAMGAVDVMAFGPYLIKDGELNEVALNKYGKSAAPRTAIGMVEPGHYFAMMLEGRHDKSKGAGISFLAERLYEKGCQVGFNLDGGQTSTMIFMGEQIVKIGQTSGKNASARKAAEIVGIGTVATRVVE